MNLIRWFAVAGLAVSASACDKSPEPFEPVEQSFSGTVGGKAWTGDLTIYSKPAPTGDSLFVFSGTPAGDPIQAQSIAVILVINGPGTYPLRENNAYFNEYIGGDVIGGSYITTSNSTGVLDLQSYGGRGTIARGRISFQAVGKGSYGSTATLQDGVFQGLVEKPPF